MSRLRGPKAFRILVLCVGAFSCAAVLALVGGIPGVLYAGGVALLAVLLLIRGRRSPRTGAGDDGAPGRLGWTRKSRRIRELQGELAAAAAHTDELHDAMTELQGRLADERASASEVQAALRARIDELESTLRDAHDSLSHERLRIDHLVERVSGDLARNGAELTTIDQRLEQLAGISG